MAGATAGASFTFVVEETNPASGRREVIFAQIARGGMSAYRGSDGVDVRDVTMNTMHNHPLEVVEAKCGGRVPGIRRAAGFRGGGPVAGRRRAGAHPGSPPRRHDPRDRRPRPYPLSSLGGAGGPARPADEGDRGPGTPGERSLGNESSLTLDRGQTVTMLTPGGSGFGDPFERDAEAVRSDVVLGFVSREGARRDYGVVLTDALGVDAAATRDARASRVRPNTGTDFDFGPERAAWERVFDDPTMLALNRGLFRAPEGAPPEGAPADRRGGGAGPAPGGVRAAGRGARRCGFGARTPEGRNAPRVRRARGRRARPRSALPRGAEGRLTPARRAANEARRDGAGNGDGDGAAIPSRFPSVR